MKIYYITFSYWNGRSYTFDYNKFFSSKQERDAAYEELRHNAGFDLCKGEDDIILPEVFDTVAFQKGVQEGRRLERDEPVTDCHDLTEAAENYIAPIENDEGLDYINFNGRDIKDAFKAGAEWQKAKMMEGAVEGKVENGCFGIVYLRKNLMNEGYSTGDKIRIVVCKKDD